MHFVNKNDSIRFVFITHKIQQIYLENVDNWHTHKKDKFHSKQDKMLRN